MEIQKLKKVKRKILKKDERFYKSKFNFGKNKDGSFITSTSGGKAHVYNSLMRRIDEERNANYSKMLEIYQNNYYSKKRKRKIKAMENKKRELYWTKKAQSLLLTKTEDETKCIENLNSFLSFIFPYTKITVNG